MNNKGMIVYKESFISKIKNFFKSLFSNKKQEYDDIQTIADEKEQELKTNQREDKFLKEIKVDATEIDTVSKKKFFIDEIDGNAQKLNMLSVDRLKKLEKYYDDIIKKNNETIKRLRANL